MVLAYPTVSSRDPLGLFIESRYQGMSHVPGNKRSADLLGQQRCVKLPFLAFAPSCYSALPLVLHFQSLLSFGIYCIAMAS